MTASSTSSVGLVHDSPLDVAVALTDAGRLAWKACTPWRATALWCAGTVVVAVTGQLPPRWAASRRRIAPSSAVVKAESVVCSRAAAVVAGTPEVPERPKRNVNSVRSGLRNAARQDASVRTIDPSFASLGPAVVAAPAGAGARLRTMRARGAASTAPLGSLGIGGERYYCIQRRCNHLESEVPWSAGWEPAGLSRARGSSTWLASCARPSSISAA